MQRNITAITTSIDLAELMNTHAPLTAEDATETPLDWPGVGLLGNDGRFVTYDLDRDASTATRCVLADGTAAVEYKTSWHAGCPMFHTMPEIEKPHWCPAEYDTTTWDDADAEVRLDWRSVYVGQASYADTTQYDTVEEAREAYEREIDAMNEAFPAGADED
ncbi:hypothetical protein [Nonomuraea sp. NPDC049129]|uniref:hypothetical protein n=1 Tax=Nonomuraea sp. NPDC049129 TaxID=3155272 RepID=UPI0033E75651